MAARPLVSARRIVLDGMRVDYRFLRVPRRRHIHVVVDDDARIEVRGPWRCSGREADSALREHATWVTSELRRARERCRRRTPLRSGAELPLLDEALVLRVTLDAQLDLLPSAPPVRVAAAGRCDKGRVDGWVHRRGRQLHARLRSLRAGALRDLLQLWFRDQAGEILPVRLDELAARLGVRPSRVTVRGQRTRWGSCSARGAISLNWRLVLLPSALTDYVLIHELCHLRHLDHSARFWDMVRGVIPDVEERRARIRQMQAGLPL